jgi:hypothetical protein
MRWKSLAAFYRHPSFPQDAGDVHKRVRVPSIPPLLSPRQRAFLFQQPDFEATSAKPTARGRFKIERLINPSKNEVWRRRDGIALMTINIPSPRIPIKENKVSFLDIPATTCTRFSSSEHNHHRDKQY